MRKLAIGPFHALSRYVSREFWTTFSLLGGEHEWHMLETAHLPRYGGHLAALLERRMSGWPDVVLFWESYPQAADFAETFAERGTRVYVMTDDLHHHRPGMTAALRAADGVLSTYAPRFPAYFPELDSSRVTWIPHAAGPDFLLPFHDAAAPVVFVSGAMADEYPLRLAMRDLALRRPGVARMHEHPGYHCTFDYANDTRIGPSYAAAMHACLAAFTDALVHEYVVAKHFEIPATGALLVADRIVAPQLAALGFIENEHYLSTTLDDLEPTIDRILNPRNRPEMDAIRRRGHALVHAQHTTANRARQIDAVCR
jgi:hypothetical protein